eukprot:GEMP01003777.1.p1 GENE.GEMP01003777.1~~GEMP01003777.1.p1  ORF type:complete len:588 (+),score=192.62 GEMP01003777.1:252-2015(+)
MACCAGKKKKTPGLETGGDAQADDRDRRERELIDQQRQEMERAAQLKAEEEEAGVRRQEELEAEAKQKELDLEASAFFREDQIETQETIIERHVLEEDQAVDYEADKMLAMRALQQDDDERALQEQEEVEALLTQRRREADEAERQREIDQRNRQREEEEMDRRFEEQRREREAEERRRRLAEEEERRRREEEQEKNREREMFNEEERLAVLRMIEEEETEHGARHDDERQGRGAAGGGDDEHYRLYADTKPLLEPPPGVSKAEPQQRRSGKKEPEEERDYRKLLPWLCCLLLLLLALLLLGYLWWHPKEVTGAANEVSNAASGAAKGVSNAATSAAHGVGGLFKPSGPEVPVLVSGGSAILVDNAGPANGKYREVVFANGTTAWQNKDCAITRTVVDVWDIECLYKIQCEKEIGAHLTPPPEHGMVCKDPALHPRLHTVHGVVHVTGNPTEDHVPGDYIEQPSNTNGKPWFKSDRDCTIHWAKTTRTWELWCFSDRWCKKVVPLYMHSDDTPLPPEGKWFTQKGRAIGKGPVPTISVDEMKTPADAIKKEIEEAGDLDEQKKAIAKAEAEAASETTQDYEVNEIHI